MIAIANADTTDPRSHTRMRDRETHDTSQALAEMSCSKAMRALEEVVVSAPPHGADYGPEGDPHLI
jgi:hypothetical protein